MQTCLFLGRFQPFHKGHHNAIIQIQQHGYLKVLVGVGSVNQQRGERNPFSGEDTLHMVSLGLKQIQIDYEVVGIPDHNCDNEWYRSICRQHRFDAIMTGNDWPAEIFSSRGHTVHRPTFEYDTNATRIRQHLQKDERSHVQEYLLPEVYEHLHTIQANSIVRRYL